MTFPHFIKQSKLIRTFSWETDTSLGAREKLLTLGMMGNQLRCVLNSLAKQMGKDFFPQLIVQMILYFSSSWLQGISEVAILMRNKEKCGKWVTCGSVSGY